MAAVLIVPTSPRAAVRLSRDRILALQSAGTAYSMTKSFASSEILQNLLFLGLGVDARQVAGLPRNHRLLCDRNAHSGLFINGQDQPSSTRPSDASTAPMGAARYPTARGLSAVLTAGRSNDREACGRQAWGV